MGMRAFIPIVMLGLTLSLLAPSVAGAFSTEVYLTSEPSGAEVYLDGKKVGVTPITVKIEGVARDHKVELRSEGCQPVVKTIRNTQPTCVPGCYPGVVAPAGYAEILEEPTLHLALQER
jgi:hypothetical protein